MAINKIYKNRIENKVQDILKDDRYMDCIACIYHIINKKFTDENILKDFSKSILSKNYISSKMTIWYYDGKKDIGVDYYNMEILWNK